MAAIFYSEDVKKLLLNSFVVIIGDSNQRGIYKDLILLLQSSRYLTSAELKSKGSKTCINDVQLEQGPKSNGTDYREVREYKTDDHWVRYYFATRVNSEYMTSVINELMNLIPDILLMNSCVWDISRYGPHSMTAYKKNLEKTFKILKDNFWDRCRVIWNTALPVASKVKGGFLLPELSSLSSSLNRDIIEGNYYACQLAEFYDFDVIDLYYMFKDLLHWRADDGIHWKAMAHRRISNIILTHIGDSWEVELPRHKFNVEQESANILPNIVNSEPRPKVPKLFNFTELDDLPHYLDFDNKAAMPKPPPLMMNQNTSNNPLPNPPKKPKTRHIPSNMIMPDFRMLPPRLPLLQRPPQRHMPPQPHMPPRLPLPHQKSHHGLFHPHVLHSMREFWQLYVGHDYGYNQHYNKPYDPRMSGQYSYHPSARHAPYQYQNIMTNSRVEYMRRQQQRIEIERMKSFRCVSLLH